MSVTNPELPQEITLGNSATLSTVAQVRNPVTGQLTPTDDAGIKLHVRDPNGLEAVYTTASVPAIQHGTGAGAYYLEFVPNLLGTWAWRWEGDAPAFGAVEGVFEVVSVYVIPTGAPDLTDLLVLVPRGRRYIEGPYGPPENRPPLEDDQVYAMVADGCADIIMATGNLFGHKLLVKSRDARVGFPTAWQTDAVLDEWEGSVIITQTALNYFFFCFRELKTSQAIKNEGTEWQYTLSTNVIRDYIKSLQSQRDLAIAGLMKHHPVLDRFASNIRVRDQATVAILEWWDNVSPGLSGGVGMPGGQEAAVIPWTPGWSGPGFSP